MCSGKYSFKSIFSKLVSYLPNFKHKFGRLKIAVSIIQVDTVEIVNFAFKKLRLHRLEANIQPENKASIALAKTCGFMKEGFSPKFIKKGGKWKDHERWALLNC